MAMIVRGLDPIDRRTNEMERDIAIASESLAVFIRIWIALTPAPAEPAAKPVRAKA